MKNRKGFTLVELLAVIAILAILVIIAMPNVLKLFNEAKMDSFLTEVKTLYKEAGRTYITEAMNGNRISSISSEGENKLDITGNNIDYCFTLDNKGNVTSMKVGKGGYYIESDGNNINELTTSDIKEGEIDVSSCGSNKPEEKPVDMTGLSLNANLTYSSFGGTFEISYSINGLSSSSNLTKVKYEIYNNTTKIDEFTKDNDKGNFSGIYNGNEYIGEYTIKAYDQNGNFMFEKSFMYCFVAGTKVKTENGYKNIEDIKVGDKVYSYNFDNNSLELSKVTGTIKSSANKTLKFHFDNDTFEVSLKHRIYVVDKGWVEAKDIVVGDILLDDSYNPVKINKIDEIVYDKPIDTYNLSINGNGNYFVTNIRILVHNSPV